MKKRILSLTLALCLLLSLLPGTAWAADEHKHNVCGATTCSHSGHSEQTFTELASITDNKLNAGSYYLTQNIENVTTTITISGAVNLCLNGKTLSGKIDSGYLIKVANSATLNICDCGNTGKIENTGLGSCVVIENGGTVSLYGGTLAKSIDNSTGNYSCVNVNQGGTLHVYGGAITTKKNYGIYNSGTLNISGGEITSEGSNAITSEGNNGQATLTVSGNPTIKSERTDGHGIFHGGKSFKLGGNPTIQGPGGDLYLAGGDSSARASITVENSLQGTFSVGLQITSDITEANPAVNITTAANADHSSLFTSFDTKYGIRNSGTDSDQVVQLYLLHKHKECGVKAPATCAHDGHTDDVEWTPLTDTTTMQDGGHYYLPGEEYNGAPAINSGATVNLCLNGHTLNRTITLNGTLNLCNCQSTGGITGQSSNPAIIGSGTLNQYGGTLSAASGGNPVNTTITLNLHGGTITGNPVKVGDTTVTVTNPASGTSVTAEHDKITIPKNSTATVENGGKTITVTTSSTGGGLVAPDSGLTTVGKDIKVQIGNNTVITTVGLSLIDLSAGTVTGTVTISDGTTTTTITPPSGGKIKPGTDGSVTVPGGSKVQTGSTEITLPSGGNGGTVKTDGSVEGSSVQVGGNTVTVTTPADKKATADKDGAVTIPGGSTVEVTNGSTTTTVTVPTGGTGTVDSTGKITFPADSTVGTDPAITVPAGSSVNPTNGEITIPGGSTVTIPDGNGGKTEITVPSSGNQTLKPTGDGKVEVPDGSKVQNGTSTEITVGPGNTGTVDPATGAVTVPASGKVTIPDGSSGTTTITVPNTGEGTITPTTGGGAVAPGGSTVTNGSNTSTVPDSGGTVKPDGTVTDDNGKLDSGETVTLTDGTEIKREDDTVTITKDGTTTTVTVPTGGEVTVDPSTGEVKVPGVSTVKTGDGPAITVPQGGSVKPGGTVTGSPVKVRDTTITAPTGQTVTTGKDGSTTILSGTTATVEKGGTATTVTVPEGDTPATVDPTTGKITVPSGTTVQTGDGPAITAGPGNGGTFDPATGGVTPNVGGKVTITDDKDNTTTITPPSGGEVKPGVNGGVDVPAGTTIQTGSGPVITVPGGGTVKPGGEVTPGSGGTVTITNGTNTTIITPPSGGSVTPSEDGGVHVDKGTTIQTGDGPVITLPESGEGGTVNPGGIVTGSPVQVGGNTVTVNKTDPSQGDITTDPSGNVTLPNGTTATVKDKDGNEITVTVPAGGTPGTVSKDGSITLPAGGTVTVPNTDGGKTEIKIPEGSSGGSTVTKNPDGTLTAPGGSTITNQDKDGNQVGDATTVTDPNGQTVTPGTGGSDTPAPTKYTVTFNSQGGSAVTAQRVESGKTAAQPTAPTRTGYTFAGWYKEAACTNAWSFDTAVTANVTLYAKWTVASYTVTFDSQSGSAVAGAAVEHGKTITKPTDPTRTGYVFGGWFTDASCTQAWDFANNIVTASRTLYAKWTATHGVTVTVTDSSNSAVNNATVKLMQGDNTVKTLTAGTDGKCSFTGVAPGKYNAVATQTVGGVEQTVTILVEVESTDAATVM